MPPEVENKGVGGCTKRLMSSIFFLKQESSPARNCTRHTARSVTCVVGYPIPDLGEEYPSHGQQGTAVKHVQQITIDEPPNWGTRLSPHIINPFLILHKKSGAFGEIYFFKFI